MSLFGDGLGAAVQKAFTRPAPKTAGPQTHYLVRQLGGTKPVTQMLRVSQRTVERYVKDDLLVCDENDHATACPDRVPSGDLPLRQSGTL